MAMEITDRETGGPNLNFPGGLDIDGINVRRNLFSISEYLIIYGTGLFLLLCPAELMRGFRIGLLIET